MKNLTQLYESQSASDIAKKLQTASNQLHFISTNMSKIEKDLEKWVGRGNYKMDYRLTDHRLYLDVTVKGSNREEIEQKAYSISFSYISLSGQKAKSDTEFTLTWNL